jgi:hypothetical protein
LATYDDRPLVTYTTESGEPVRLEIRETSGFVPVHGDRPLGRIERVFRNVIQAAEALAREARRTNPDEVKIRFGIKFTGTGDAVVARQADEGNFEISLSWNRDSRGPEA